MLTVDGLIETALRDTGLYRFDSESFREGLEILVADVNADDLPSAAKSSVRDRIVKAIGDRLKTTGYLDSHKDLLTRPVERPVFVFGMPRTGTTLLSNPLAADPARRSPLSWEIEDPVPPARAGELLTDPRAVAGVAAETKMLEAHPDAGKYYRNSAIYPNECVFFMAHDFKTLMWAAFTRRLGYRDWIYLAADMGSAYRYHKRFLQLLQSEVPGVWNLKMPSHALWLEPLLEVYPDARLVWTHRDPLTATGSFCSLNTIFFKAFDCPIDLGKQGENYAWQAVEHLDRIMDSRDRLGEDRIADVHYADLLRDPICTMRALYRALGDEFTAEAEAGMRSWLAINPQDKFGRHDYRLAEFGLNPETLLPRFERYLSRYTVEREDR